MSFCTRCQKINILTLQADFLLHEDWPALENCVADTGCELCRIIFERLTVSLCMALPKFVIDQDTVKIWDLDADGCLVSLPLDWYRGCHTNIVVQPVKDRFTFTFDSARSVEQFQDVKLESIRYEGQYLAVSCKEYGASPSWRTAYISKGNIVGSNLHYAEKGDGLFYKFQQGMSLPIFALKGDPLPNYLKVPVRRLLGHNDSNTVKMQKAAQWIDECQRTHEECRDPGDPNVFPKRLVRLEQTNEGLFASIIEIDGIPPDGYAALSYCWGEFDQQWIIDIKRLHEECIGFNVNTMPATLRDAAVVCHELGFGYLWIDALCILQGNLDDWLIESEKMSDIFANSTVTISATDVANCSDGFLDRDRGERCNLIKLRLQTEEGPGTLWLSKSPWNPGDFVMEGFVGQRGWCLQERHFSPRILHYCREEVYLECSRNRRYESEMVRNPEDDRGITNEKTRDLPMKELDALRARQAGLSGARKPAVQLWTNRMWYETVRDYSLRQLTQSDDKLIAISGLVKRANQHVESDYLAGIWLSHLAFGMSWNCDTTIDRPYVRPRRASKYRAPSWSWASIDGVIDPCAEFNIIDGSFSKLNTAPAYTPAIDFVRAEVQTRKDQPFGQVLEAALYLKGKLKLVDLSKLRNISGQYSGPWSWQPNPNNPYENGAYIEDEHRNLSGDYWCLYLGLHSVYAPAPSKLILIVLESVECDIPDTYRRVGWATIWDLEYFADTSESAFRLI